MVDHLQLVPNTPTATARRLAGAARDLLIDLATIDNADLDYQLYVVEQVLVEARAALDYRRDTPAPATAVVERFRREGGSVRAAPTP